MFTSLKKTFHNHTYTALIVFRLVQQKNITIGKSIKAFANFLACLLHRPPRFYPAVLQFDITNTCNLHCTGCPTGLGVHRRPPGFMPLENFTSIIDAVKGTTALAVLYNSGEPMLHPRFTDMVAHLSAANIASMVSTNGHFIDTPEKAETLINAGLTLIIFSLSGATQQTYETYHVGGRLDTVLQSISLLKAAKRRLKSRTPVILVRILLMPHNRHELTAMRTLARKTGADITETRVIRWHTELVASTEQKNDCSGALRLNLRNKVCQWPWLISVINWDGVVVPCCFFYLDIPEMGNAFTTGGFKGVWNGAKYQAFRQQMGCGKNTIPLCRECPAETGFQTTFSEQDRTIRIFHEIF
ncbi:MAG: radical SAM protein [Thermodesulfobacteriota bacterium]|nr:radical SAM protein [Thermodesulfobacteriota bacterium]